MARLALAGKISFTYQKNELPLRKAYEPLTSVRKRGEIRISKIRQHDERQLKKAADLAKGLFNKTFTGSSEKELSDLISQELKGWQDALKGFKSKAETGHYPGKDKIEAGLILTNDLLEQSNSYNRVQNFLVNSDALEDFSEDFEDLDDFYTSQFGTWQQLSQVLEQQFKPNRIALDKDLTAAKALTELEQIYNHPEPYGMLQKVSGLITQVQRINEQLVEAKRTHALGRVDLRIGRVKQVLEDANASNDLQNKAQRPLQLCKQRIEKTQSLHEIISEQAEAEGFEDDAYTAINAYIESQKPKVPPVTPSSTGAGGSTPPVPPKPVKAKQTVTISPADIYSTMFSGVFLESSEDVDSYLKSIKEQLMKVVESGDRIRIK
jgi:hypothetical protein